MILDWFKTLFDATGFQTRGRCGPWSESLVHFYVFSSSLITLAYVIMAACLYSIWRKRRTDTQHEWILLLFVAVIAVCGVTHACDVAVFWWPGYRLFTVFGAVAAILSLTAALCLSRLTQVLVDIPSLARFQTITSELTQAIALKEKAINDSRATIAALRRQVDHLERMRMTGLWVTEQESALRELKTALESSTREAPL